MDRPNPPSWPRALALALLLGAFMLGLVGGAFGGAAVALALNRRQASPAATSPPPTPGPLPTPIRVEISTAVTDAVAKLGPAVVTVVAHLPPQPSFFGPVERTSTGSGVIVSQAGHIVTNNHVVEGAEQVEVILADGTRLPADLVGTDPFADLAVVQAAGEMPAVAEWGNSDALKPGETVIAIGSPLGAFINTVTVGVVSATGRSIETGRGYALQDLIQTDAAINEGNSGGPLINLAGQVVGINTLVVRGGGSTVAEGLGFAIPSNTARAVADQLISKGYVSRPYLGIRWQWVTPGVAARFGLPVEYGVFITDLDPQGPAAQAGLRRGDILIAIEGEAIGPDTPFINLLFRHEPGETVTLTVVRGDRRLEVQVTLGEVRIG